MNDADSERLLGILGSSGYDATDRPEEADLILLNTCAIRHKAEHKVFSDLGRFKALKIRNPSLTIGVAGCVAQSLGRRIFSREPAVDFVLGTRNLADLPDLLRKAGRGEKGASLSPSKAKAGDRARPVRSNPVHAYVPVIHGCENFCSYCVVPYVRGPERSRPAEEILEEIRGLADRGLREVTLLGQNVNSYGKKDNKNISFSKLLHLIHEIEGLQRIRFVTSHPRDLSAEMIEAVSSLPKVCEALHLPVQSGSDRILASMKRGYTRSEYLEKLSLLRESIPEISVTTDVIVGFPGETEEDFADTLSLLLDARFDHLFGFCFSPRPGTPASLLAESVDEGTAGKRLRAVFDLQKQISLSRNRDLVGACLEVLVEGPGPKGAGNLIGRTRTNKIVHFPGTPDLAGSLIRVRIAEGLPNCLIGEAL